MEEFIQNFMGLLPAIVIFVGILFSIFSSKKEHFTIMAGIFLIIGLSLFANHWTCYFAAILIVGTIVTKTEFLQNIAAIIRGNKEYFNYKTESMSSNEIEDSFKEKAKGIEISQDEIVKIDYLFYQKVEAYAFRYFESKFKRPIQRHIRFLGENTYAEFEGLMQFDKVDVIFELVVITGRLPSKETLLNFSRRYISDVKEYQNLTKRDATVRFIILCESENIDDVYKLTNELLNEVYEIKIDYEVYSLEDIGLPADVRAAV